VPATEFMLCKAENASLTDNR